MVFWCEYLSLFSQLKNGSHNASLLGSCKVLNEIIDINMPRQVSGSHSFSKYFEDLYVPGTV